MTVPAAAGAGGSSSAGKQELGRTPSGGKGSGPAGMRMLNMATQGAVDSVRRKKAEKVVAASSPAAEGGAPAASSAPVDDSTAASPRERESNVAASGSKSVAAKALAAVAKQSASRVSVKDAGAPASAGASIDLRAAIGGAVSGGGVDLRDAIGKSKPAPKKSIEDRMDFDAVVVPAAAVVPLYPAHERKQSDRPFTNVFVKNFRDDVTDEQFQAAFAGCGKITSAVIARDDAGKSKRHGFVNFEAPEAALKCIQQFNGSSGLAAAGEAIDVVEHLKKSERFASAAHVRPFHPKAGFNAHAPAAGDRRPRPQEETPEAAAERKAKKIALLMSGVMPVRPQAAKWVAKAATGHEHHE